MPSQETVSPQQTECAWRGRFVTHAIAVLAVAIWRWNSDREGQRPILGRMTAHVALALTLGLLLALSNVQVSKDSPRTTSWAAAQPPGDQGVVPSGGVEYSPVTRTYSNAGLQVQISRQAQPHTAIPDRPRLDIVTYMVQPGDTTESIAAAFGLQPTTIMWSNPELEKAPDLLKVGQELVILPLDGVYHVVEAGDTLQKVAEKYKVAPEDIVACPFNALDGSRLTVGLKVIVPNGTKPYETRTVTTYSGPVPDYTAGVGIFFWPASGYISQGYWYGHRAIDIANAVGAAILASDAGYVSFAGWTDVGYGYLVVIDHGNGYQTYYAHLSNIFVVESQVVTAGQVVGAMGSTGNSTGPHLHFEVRYNGYPTNPLIYLP
ncbi:MAG: M23 family metallopeptidase [Anaerolineae bacterium]|nr:M23 family metallopeptidase [Anaerolineae bacterium]